MKKKSPMKVPKSAGHPQNGSGARPAGNVKNPNKGCN